MIENVSAHIDYNEANRTRQPPNLNVHVVEATECKNAKCPAKNASSLTCYGASCFNEGLQVDHDVDRRSGGAGATGLQKVPNGFRPSSASSFGDGGVVFEHI